MTVPFSKISKISATLVESWLGRIFLTFDIDWAHDDVLADSIDLVEQAGVCATWFVTHETLLLKRLRQNPNFELSIHPNFNLLLLGWDGCRGRNAAEVVERLISLIPEERSIRSNSVN